MFWGLCFRILGSLFSCFGVFVFVWGLTRSSIFVLGSSLSQLPFSFYSVSYLTVSVDEVISLIVSSLQQLRLKLICL